MAVGDLALAAQEEHIEDHYFDPDNENTRTIWFKGHYLSIYNEGTEHLSKHISLDIPTTTFERYEVPAGYTVCVRASTVYFMS